MICCRHGRCTIKERLTFVGEADGYCPRVSKRPVVIDSADRSSSARIARECGALGAKLPAAGGGGAVIALCDGCEKGCKRPLGQLVTRALLPECEQEKGIMLRQAEVYNNLKYQSDKRLSPVSLQTGLHDDAVRYLRPP